MSLHNFLLFHLRRHVKNSGFVLHHWFQTPRNHKSTRSTGTRDEALALFFDILHETHSLSLSLVFDIIVP